MRTRRQTQTQTCALGEVKTMAYCTCSSKQETRCLCVWDSNAATNALTHNALPSRLAHVVEAEETLVKTRMRDVVCVGGGKWSMFEGGGP